MKNCDDYFLSPLFSNKNCIRVLWRGLFIELGFFFAKSCARLGEFTRIILMSQYMENVSYIRAQNGECWWKRGWGLCTKLKGLYVLRRKLEKYAEKNVPTYGDKSKTSTNYQIKGNSLCLEDFCTEQIRDKWTSPPPPSLPLKWEQRFVLGEAENSRRADLHFEKRIRDEGECILEQLEKFEFFS